MKKYKFDKNFPNNLNNFFLNLIEEGYEKEKTFEEIPVSDSSSPFQHYWRFAQKDKNISLFILLPDISGLSKEFDNFERKNLDIRSSIDYSGTFGIGNKPVPFIQITLKNIELIDNFIFLVRSLVEKVMQSKNSEIAVKEILNTLNHWINLLSPSNKGLSKSEILGIYGELRFIEECTPYLDLYEIIDSWEGPDRGIHDFVFQNNSIEIKSITTNQISIHGENQLMSNEEQVLYLNIRKYQYDESGRGDSIVDVIERIMKLIDNKDQEALLLAKLRMANIGNYEDYKNIKFACENSMYYLVDENFPRIIINDIDNLISNVNYKIDVSGMSSSIKLKDFF